MLPHPHKAKHDAPMNAQQPITPARYGDIPDDMPMLRAAVELTRDIAEARPGIYWPDMVLSAAVGYAGIAGAVLLENRWLAVASAVIAVLALYRALLFIHELTHLHRDALPGFRFAWNVLVGIPMLTPSLMYEGVHTLHHARTRYGTIEDPEYLPLALMKPWSLPMFLAVAILLPPALLIRSALLVPLGALIPPLGREVWARASALSINPAFRRRPAEGDFARIVRWQEIGATLWAWALLASTQVWGWRWLLIAMAIVAAVAVFNQMRTLVAHLWQNDGEAMTVTAQYLDSVNVPGVLAGLWAPIGLRYHATHHLLPSMPYHSLHEAHRRIAAHLGNDSNYMKSAYPGLWPLLGHLVRSTMVKR